MYLVWIEVVLFGVFLVWAVLRGRHTCFVFPYLFFLRFPLLAAGALFALPALSDLAPSLFANLFVLHPVQAGIVGFLAQYAAWAIAYSFMMTYVAIPARCELPFLRAWRADPADPEIAEPDPADRKGRIRTAHPDNGLGKTARKWVRGAAIALALPLFGAVVARVDASETGVVERGPTLLGIVAGVGSAWVVWWVWTRAMAKRAVAGGGLQAVHPKVAAVLELPARAAEAIDPAARLGLDPQPVPVAGFTLTRAWALLMLSVAIYTVAGSVGLAQQETQALDTTLVVPTLGYVLIVLAGGVQLLSGLAYWLDVYRVPVLAAAFAYVVLAGRACGTDASFHVLRPAQPRNAGALDPSSAVRAWGERHPALPAAVIVTASGGGIAASRWTAQVLHRLNAALGPKFASSIVLVSTVSGGGVGAMYFVSAYDDGRAPDAAASESALHWSGRSSLDAVGWGIAYPDLIRSAVPALDWFRWRLADQDRGRALERRWRGYWSSDVPTLDGWRAGVAAGWRPAQVFNATAVESGERYLLTPLDAFGTGTVEDRRRRFFSERHGGMDVAVVSAARLSATFPYVSPAARLRAADAEAANPIHVVDGGYHDNFGTLTAVEFVQASLAEFAKLRSEGKSVKRVVVVDIRLDDAAAAAEDPAGSGGPLYEAIAPLLAMLNVRGPGQAVHREIELEAVCADRPGDFPVRRVTFATSKAVPLSWHLTRREAAGIDGAWDEPQNVAAFKRLRELLE